MNNLEDIRNISGTVLGQRLLNKVVFCLDDNLFELFSSCTMEIPLERPDYNFSAFCLASLGSVYLAASTLSSLCLGN